MHVSLGQEIRTKYLSDIDPAYKELEDRQKNAAFKKDIKGNPIVFDHKEITVYLNSPLDTHYNIKTTPQQLRALKNENLLHAKLTTRYQEPITYYQLKELISELNPIVKKMFPESSYQPKFGTVFTNMIDAERSDENYLLIEHFKFLDFCNEVAKYGMYSVGKIGFPGNIISSKSTSVRDYEQRLIDTITHDKGLLVNSFFLMLRFHNKSFTKRLDTLEMSNTDGERYSDSLSQAMKWFAIGHEYGHAVKKHWKVLEDDPDTLNSTIIIRSWVNEIQADSVGQEVLLAKLQKDQAAIYPFSTDFLEIGGEFILECQYMLENVNEWISKKANVPELTGQEIAWLDTLTRRNTPITDKERLFQKINPYFTHSLHPPTMFRMHKLTDLTTVHFVKKYQELTEEDAKVFAVFEYNFGRGIVMGIKAIWDFEKPLVIRNAKLFEKN